MVLINYNAVAIIALRQLIKNNGSCRVNISGTSMLPMLRNGEKAMITQPDRIRMGDIAVFKYNDTLFVHRVIHSDGSRLVTKGDNSFSTEAISAADVVGVAVGLELPDGRVYLFRHVPLLGASVALFSRAVDRYRQKGHKIKRTRKTLRYRLLYILSACSRRFGKKMPAGTPLKTV